MANRKLSRLKLYLLPVFSDQTSIENFAVGHQIPLIVDFVSDRTKLWKCSRGRASGEAAWRGVGAATYEKVNSAPHRH